jgi:hypothetical protein
MLNFTEDGGGFLSFVYNATERLFISFQSGNPTYVDINLSDMVPLDCEKPKIASIEADFVFKRSEYWVFQSDLSKLLLQQ